VAPLTPIDRRSFDYSDLGHWMTQMDEALRRSRRVLGQLAKPRVLSADATQMGDVTS
jgi:hypothetical protein